MDLRSIALSLLADVQLEALAHAMKSLSEELGQEGKLGGTLAIAAYDVIRKSGGMCAMSFGDPGFKFGRVTQNASEKITRLHKLRLEGSNDIASSQSADPNNPDERLRTYGGGIVFTKVINEITYEIYIAISGGPAAVDEALVYAIGSRLGLTTFAYTNDHLERAIALTSDVVCLAA